MASTSTTSSSMPKEITGFVRALKAGDPAAFYGLLDWMQENGLETLAERIVAGKLPSWRCHERNAALVGEAIEGHFEAVLLHERLPAALERDDLPERNRDLPRSCERKVLAARLRSELRKLGLPGIRVTCPVYSMATTVHVKVPRRLDVNREDLDCPAHLANRAGYRWVEELVFLLFPNHRAIAHDHWGEVVSRCFSVSC